VINLSVQLTLMAYHVSLSLACPSMPLHEWFNVVQDCTSKQWTALSFCLKLSFGLRCKTEVKLSFGFKPVRLRITLRCKTSACDLTLSRKIKLSQYREGV